VRPSRTLKPKKWALCIKDPKGKNGFYNYTEGLKYSYTWYGKKRHNVQVNETSMTTIGHHDGMPMKVFDEHFKRMEIEEFTKEQALDFLDQQLLCALYEWEATYSWIYQVSWAKDTMEIIRIIEPDYPDIFRKHSKIHWANVSSKIVTKCLDLLG